jgi:RNA polymerase sigma-70 factor (ECF subfamily)
MLTVPSRNQTDAETGRCCSLKIRWRLKVLSDCLVPSIDEAPRVKDFNSKYSLPGRDENALVTAAKTGQTSAFNELWQSHSNRLYWTTFRITKNREDAEDALQGALLNAFVHLQTFDGRSSFLTWLTRIAINPPLMIVRKNRSTLQVSLDDTGDGRGPARAGTLLDPALDPEAHSAQRECEAILAKAIRRLRPSFRQALILQKLEEHPRKDAAQIMRISVSAAKARLFHAKNKLQKSLHGMVRRPCAPRRNRQLPAVCGETEIKRGKEGSCGNAVNGQITASYRRSMPRTTACANGKRGSGWSAHCSYAVPLCWRFIARPEPRAS